MPEQQWCERGAPNCQVYFQLEPGETCFVRLQAAPSGLPDWPAWKPIGEPVEVKGSWKVTFVEGGPLLPESFTTDELLSWTVSSDAAENFAGTARYTLQFEGPAIQADAYELLLGDVRESARVSLNGTHVATLVANPCRCVVKGLRQGTNELTIEVTNLSANRIRDLDRRGVPWRKFYDINFVNINYKPFDASQWTLRPSGLLGPVTLQPIKTQLSKR